MAPRNTVTVAGSLTPSEQAHIDSRGETAIEAEAPAAEEAEPVEEPAAVAEPEPAAVEDADDGEPPAAADGKPSMVPHAALHEARQKEKAAAKMAEDYRLRAEQSEKNRLLMEERTNMILQSLAQPQQQAAPEPELPPIEQDPAGHIIALLQQQQKVIDALQQQNQQRSQWDQQSVQQQQQMQQLQAIANRSVSMERQFIEANPDYNDATAHLMKVRDAELAAVGYQDPAERQAILQQEAQQIGIRAAAMNANPAEWVYKIAETRGYKKAAAAQEVIPPNGADNVTRLQTAQRGKDQSASLSQVRGTGSVPMTAQRLLEMSPEEFAEALKTPAGKALMG